MNPFRKAFWWAVYSLAGIGCSTVWFAVFRVGRLELLFLVALIAFTGFCVGKVEEAARR